MVVIVTKYLFNPGVCCDKIKVHVQNVKQTNIYNIYFLCVTLYIMTYIYIDSGTPR